MADDLNHADLVQIAAATAAEGQATEDCPEEGGDAEACAAVAGAGAGVIVISQPPDGEVVVVPPQGDQTYLLNFPADSAEVLVIDDDGDGIADRLVLRFHTGTDQESQLVFDLAAHAGSSFQIGGIVIDLGALVAYAQTIEGQQPFPLDTAADLGEPGHGVNVYNDNSGPTAGLLAHEGPIPPRFLEFGLNEQEVIDFVEILASPTARDDLDMVREGCFEGGEGGQTGGGGGSGGSFSSRSKPNSKNRGGMGPSGTKRAGAGPRSSL